MVYPVLLLDTCNTTQSRRSLQDAWNISQSLMNIVSLLAIDRCENSSHCENGDFCNSNNYDDGVCEYCSDLLNRCDHAWFMTHKGLSECKAICGCE